jgi:hypothetical protein
VEHDIATTSYTLERYVLGELSESDRDLFEEHYFDCAECAGQVRDFSEFATGARAVLAGQRRFPHDKPGWLDPLRLFWRRPAFAALCLSALVVSSWVTAYQAGARRGQAQPQAVASVLLRPETRGEDTSIAAQTLGAFLLIELDVPGAHGELRWEVRGSGSPNPLMAGAAAAPAAGDSLKLLLPAARLAPARYILTVRSKRDAGSAASTVEAAYRFRID